MLKKCSVLKILLNNVNEGTMPAFAAASLRRG